MDLNECSTAHDKNSRRNKSLPEMGSWPSPAGSIWNSAKPDIYSIRFLLSLRQITENVFHSVYPLIVIVFSYFFPSDFIMALWRTSMSITLCIGNTLPALSYLLKDRPGFIA